MKDLLVTLTLALVLALASGCGKLDLTEMEETVDLMGFTEQLEDDGEIIEGDPTIESGRGALARNQLRMDVSWGATAPRYGSCVEWDLTFKRSDNQPLKLIRRSRLERYGGFKDEVRRSGDLIVAKTRTTRGTDGFRAYLPKNVKVLVTGTAHYCNGGQVGESLELELEATYGKRYVYKSEVLRNKYLGGLSF